MMNEAEVTAQILEALRELNQQLPHEQQLPVSPDTPLFGHEGQLDSFGMVNLILVVEERIHDEFGIEITLSDNRTMSELDSPFRNVHTLAEYVNGLIEANAQQPNEE